MTTAADYDVAYAALTPAQVSILINSGLIADPLAVPTNGDDAASVAAREDWVEVDPAELQFEETEYVEPFTNVGGVDDVSALLESVPFLLERDASTGAVPEVVAAIPGGYLGAAAVATRAQQLAGVWTAEALPAQINLWDDGIVEAAADPEYVSYADAQFATTSWEGVDVDGDNATAYLTGHVQYTLSNEPVQTGRDQQYQVTLSRDVGSPAGWLMGDFAQVDVPVAPASPGINRTLAAAAPMAAGAIDRAKVRTWANSYTFNAVKPADNGKCRMKQYVYVSANDCTNMASQALKHAGMNEAYDLIPSPLDTDEAGEWYYSASTDRAPSWANVTALKTFMVDKSHRAKIIEIPKAKHGFMNSGAKTGDLYMYDYTAKAGLDHTAVSGGVGAFAKFSTYRQRGTSGSRMTQHTNDRVDAPYNWGWRQANQKDRSHLKMYIIHFTFDD